MKRRQIKLVGYIIVILFAAVLSYSQRHSVATTTNTTSTANMAASSSGSYTINHFIDGDTISVNINGKAQSVRFIGVDTPETHKPNTPIQCYGPEAAAHTKAMIGSGPVRLVSDPEGSNKDKYGRLLRYVYLSNGTDLDELNIQQGYGFYYPYFKFSKSAQFDSDQQLAMSKHLGLWGACKPTATDDGGYVSNTQGT